MLLLLLKIKRMLPRPRSSLSLCLSLVAQGVWSPPTPAACYAKTTGDEWKQESKQSQKQELQLEQLLQ